MAELTNVFIFFNKTFVEFFRCFYFKEDLLADDYMSINRIKIMYV